MIPSPLTLWRPVLAGDLYSMCVQSDIPFSLTTPYQREKELSLVSSAMSVPSEQMLAVMVNGCHGLIVPLAMLW